MCSGFLCFRLPQKKMPSLYEDIHHGFLSRATAHTLPVSCSSACCPCLAYDSRSLLASAVMCVLEPSFLSSPLESRRHGLSNASGDTQGQLRLSVPLFPCSTFAVPLPDSTELSECIPSAFHGAFALQCERTDPSVQSPDA